MRHIIISDALHERLKRRAYFPWSETGEQLSTGAWKIPLSEETIADLEEIKFEHETLAMTIERLCDLADSGGKH